MTLWDAHAGAGSGQGPADLWREDPILELVSWQDL